MNHRQRGEAHQGLVAVRHQSFSECIDGVSVATPKRTKLELSSLRLLEDTDIQNKNRDYLNNFYIDTTYTVCREIGSRTYAGYNDAITRLDFGYL